MEAFELKEIFRVSPSDIYHAWLDSALHSAMTGGEAVCGDQIGDSFTAWDGYIFGTNIELVTNQKIEQHWRTSEFSEKDEASLLSITLNKVSGGTELVLSHSNIPKGQTQYEQGWLDHYFTPMKEYFAEDR